MLMSERDVDTIHRKTLDVLEGVGIVVGSERVMKALADEGARVDFGQGRVWFPPDLIETKVALAPRTFTLAGRDPRFDIDIDGRHGYLSTDGCGSEFVDTRTGERRRSTKSDLETITRLADALPEIGFHWQPVSANDMPAASRPLHEIHAQFPNTGKHIQQMTVIDPVLARGAVEMATVVAGSSQALRRRPLMSNFQCSISPLAWHEGPLEAMLVFAEAGLPTGICSMPLSAATAPATVAGLIVTANAEILAGIAMLETIVPGAPTFYISYATSMDMNSGALNLAWGPEDIFAEMACSQMAHFYGLPAAVGTFGTGAKAPDWQAGVQNALSGITSFLLPGDMLTSAGSLYGDRVYSLESLMLDAEIFNYLCRLWDGFDIGDETTGVEVIEAVGPEGHFLAAPHTLAHMRDAWQTRFFDRGSWEDWAAAGRPTPADSAREAALRILEVHEPAPLDDDVNTELLSIVDAYERELT